MGRSVRHLLIASLIACHAAVTLCGPCLHEIAGSGHAFGPVSASHRPDAPAKSPADSSDNCPICHFVAQGQLIVAPTCALSAPLVVGYVAVEPPIARPLACHFPSSPRAPPAFPSTVA